MSATVLVAMVGDAYLRKLLIPGARSLCVTKVLQSAQCPFKVKWLIIDQHKLKNVAVMVIANKNVRVAWSLLFYDEAVRHDYESGSAVRRMVLHIKAE